MVQTLMGLSSNQPRLSATRWMLSHPPQRTSTTPLWQACLVKERMDLVLHLVQQKLRMYIQPFSALTPGTRSSIEMAPLVCTSSTYSPSTTLVETLASISSAGTSDTANYFLSLNQRTLLWVKVGVNLGQVQIGVLRVKRRRAGLSIRLSIYNENQNQQTPNNNSQSAHMQIQLKEFQNGKPLVLAADLQHLTSKINRLRHEKKFEEIFVISDNMKDSAEKYLLATNALLHLRDWKRLVQYCDRGLEISEEGEFYHLKGKALGKLGDNQKKVQLIQKAIELNSNIPAYHRNLGAAFYSLKKYEIAIQCHQKAINLEPDSAINYHNKGLAHYRLGQFGKAQKQFRMAIDKSPKLALSYSWCGDCLRQQQKYEAALEYYSRAYDLQQNPVYLHEKEKLSQKIKERKSGQLK